MSILKDLFYRKITLLIMIMLSAFRSFLSVCLSYIIIPLVDEGVRNGTWNYILFLYSILFILNLVIRIIQKKIYYLNEEMLEKNTFDQYVGYVLNSNNLKKSSEYLADVNDRWVQVREALLNSLEVVLLYPFNFFACFLFLSYVNFSICIIVYALALFATLFTFKKKSNLFDFQRNVSIAREKLLGLQKESIENHEFISFYALQDYMLTKHDELTSNVYETEKEYYKRLSISYFPALINEYLPMIVFIFVAFHYLYKGLIGYGELFSMLQIVSMISLPMGKFVKNYIICKNATGILKSLKMPTNKNNSHDIKKLDVVEMDFKNCNFSYSFENKIVKDFTFHFVNGDKVAIVGESGNGKSTLLSLIGGFFNWDSGDFIINKSIHITKDNSSILIKNESYVDDQLYLLPGNLSFNIAGINMDDQRYHNVLKIFDINNDLDKDVIEQNGTNFSGGEKLKINLARSSYKECNLHLFDEPTAHLDVDAKEHFYKYFKKLEGITFLVTHDETNIKLCNKVLYINNGMVKQIDVRKFVE